jgi:hypothetical protein
LPLLASFVRRAVRKLNAANLKPATLGTATASGENNDVPVLWPHLAKAARLPPLLIERIVRQLRRSLDDCSILTAETKDDAVDFFLPFFKAALIAGGCSPNAKRNLTLEIAGQLALLSAAVADADSASTLSISQLSFSNGTPAGLLSAHAAVVWASSAVLSFFQLACRANLSLGILRPTEEASLEHYALNMRSGQETFGLYSETTRFANSTKQFIKQLKANKSKVVYIEAIHVTGAGKALRADRAHAQAVAVAREQQEDEQRLHEVDRLQRADLEPYAGSRANLEAFELSLALDELAAEVAQGAKLEVLEGVSFGGSQGKGSAELEIALSALAAEAAEATQQLEGGLL